MVDEPTHPPSGDPLKGEGSETDPSSDTVPVRRESPARPMYSEDQSPVINDSPLKAPVLIHIEGYETLRALGPGGRGGGQAEVFEAIQLSTTMTVAIKVLRRAAHDSEAARRLFRQEIQLLAQVKHPNVVKIHEAGVTSDGRLFYVMEYVKGLGLRAHVQTYRLTFGAMLELFTEACDAVEHLHRLGIVHRDLKPANIFVDEQGRPKVLDLGLASPLAMPDLVTPSGWMGTLAYLSPEQTRPDAQETDARSDVYALGVVLYHLLTGAFPYCVFDGRDAVIGRIRHDDPVPPRRNLDADAVPYAMSDRRCPIDAELEGIVLKALSKDRKDRYASAGILGRNVHRYLKAEPVDPGPASVPHWLYKGLTACRTAYNRQPVIALGLLTFLVWTMVEFLGAPLLHAWTGANETYERLLRVAVPNDISEAAFRDVRVIGLTDDILIEEGERNGVETVSKLSQIRSIRARHGKLMEQLAKSGCRVVVWDMAFSSSSDFDEVMAAGIRSLTQARIPVVMPVSNWWLGDDALPLISSALIGSNTILGGSSGQFGRDGWGIHVAVQRGLRDPLPSIAIAAFAAFRRPGKQYDIRLDPAGSQLGLSYYQVNAADPKRKLYDQQVDLVSVSTIGRVGDGSGTSEEVYGLERGDAIAYQMLTIPERQELDNVTLNYGDVLTADESKLQGWFRDRAVVIGNTSTLVRDEFPTPEGPEIPGVYSHALAIDGMLRTSTIQLPNRVTEAIASLGATILGCFIGFRLRGRAMWRYVALSIWTVALLIVSLVLFQRAGYIWGPLVSVLALWLSSEAVVLNGRMCRRPALA